MTSFYPVFVATLNVADGVPGIEVSNLASPHIGCLHDYQLTAADVRALASAHLLLANGAGMESFLDKLRRTFPALRIVEVSAGIPLMDGNPHVWVSFEGARRHADNIASALAEVAPDRAEKFRENARRYRASIDALEARLTEKLAPHRGAAIITFHEAFPYLARDFGLVVVGVVEREPGSEPGARELAETIRLARAHRVRAIFTEPQFSDRSARVIARESGARVYELDPVVTGPPEPEKAKGAWLRAMEQNAVVLARALG